MKRLLISVLATTALVGALPTARAALFEDDEARRAILDLRQRHERQNEAIDQLRRALLDQQNALDALRQEIARLRGDKENLNLELQRQLDERKEQTRVLEERLRKFEPRSVKVDGEAFLAEPAEIAAYEEALATFRAGDFKTAATAFAEFQRRFPRSGYTNISLFWLGNAQYANRDNKEAIRSFLALLARAPDHVRAPEAMLSVANSQIELKEVRPARKTLEELIAKYPSTEAAVAAKERLAKLK